MASTDTVLASIGTLVTLVDNFPMSIFDLFKGKTYTSIFEFLIDVLTAFGVPIDEAIEWILKEIYSIETGVENIMENFNEALANADFKEPEESHFLNMLDYTLKTLIMTVLSSVYGCSSIPMLPNKVMDYPCPDIFGNSNSNWDNRWKLGIYPGRFEIPAKMIDPMGMLEITPTSTEGNIFYETGGRELYYKKEKISSNIGATISNNAYSNVKENVSVKVIIEQDGDNHWLYFKLGKKVPENIKLSFDYYDNDISSFLEWETNIKIATTESDTKLLINNCSEIRNVLINNNISSYNIYGGICCLLSREESILGEYEHLFENVKWGDNGIMLGSYEGNEEKQYKYVQCDKKEVKKTAKRVSTPPSNPGEKDPDYIVVYKGPNPNELYKTFDMNAFIWYVLNKSSRHTQREINYTMWDSRLRARRRGNIRNNKANGYTDYFNDKQKIKWYASKSGSTGEFLDIKKTDKYIEKGNAYYPILQLKKASSGIYGMEISFPAQRYYKPTFRFKTVKKLNNGEEDDVKGKPFNFNASIYQFNWEYLLSIKILKPKIMLAGFVNYLTGGLLYEASTAEFNFTKQLIKSKISSSVKKIIEADDMEVEDCYTTFSNDEVNSMLEDMLLSRNNMTYQGGEKYKTKYHDVNSYYDSINSIAASTTREESVTKLTKLLDDATVSPGEEGSINYGFETNINGQELLYKVIWAVIMPIVESLFTPQVLLLFIINMSLTGMVNLANFDLSLSVLFNLIFNKIMGLIKAIIKFIKDKIVELIYQFILNKIMPLILKWLAALNLEKLRNWLLALEAAIKCLPLLPMFDLNKKINSGIDEVNYADIIKKDVSDIPESLSPC